MIKLISTMYKFYSFLSILSLLFTGFFFWLAYITFNLTQDRSFRAKEDRNTKKKNT